MILQSGKTTQHALFRQFVESLEVDAEVTSPADTVTVNYSLLPELFYKLHRSKPTDKHQCLSLAVTPFEPKFKDLVSQWKRHFFD